MAALELQTVNGEDSDLEDDFSGPDSRHETGDEVWNLRFVRFFNIIKLLNFKLKSKILFFNFIQNNIVGVNFEVCVFFSNKFLDSTAILN